MDSQLQDRLKKWHDHIEILEVIEEDYLILESQEKTVEGDLYITTTGTVDERKSEVYSSEVYKEFKRSLATKKAQYNKAKRLLELKIKAYEAEYATYKREMEAIRKHP